MSLFSRRFQRRDDVSDKLLLPCRYVAVSDFGFHAEYFGYALRGETFCHRALVEDVMVVEEYQPGAVAVGEVEVVDDDEDGLLLVAVEIAQERHDLVLVRYVEVGGGFVEEHYGCLLCEGSCEHDALQLAAAHLVGLGVAQMPGVGHAHGLFDDVVVALRLVLEAVLVGVAPHEYDLEGGELEVGGGVLPHDGDGLGKLACTVGTQIARHQLHFAGRGLKESSETAQKCGFPTAVGAHDGVEAAGLDGEIDVGEHFFLSEPKGEVMCFEFQVDMWIR